MRVTRATLAGLAFAAMEKVEHWNATNPDEVMNSKTLVKMQVVVDEVWRVALDRKVITQDQYADNKLQVVLEEDDVVSITVLEGTLIECLDLKVTYDKSSEKNIVELGFRDPSNGDPDLIDMVALVDGKELMRWENMIPPVDKDGNWQLPEDGDPDD